MIAVISQGGACRLQAAILPTSKVKVWGVTLLLTNTAVKYRYIYFWLARKQITTNMRAITTAGTKPPSLPGGWSWARRRPKRCLTGPALVISQERSVVTSVETRSNTGNDPAKRDDTDVLAKQMIRNWRCKNDKWYFDYILISLIVYFDYWSA